MQFVYGYLRQVLHLDFGINLKNRIKRHFSLRRLLFFADAGLAGHAQLGFYGRCIEGFAHFVIHDFVMHRVTIALGHDVHGHFARTEAINLYFVRQLFQSRIHFILDDGSGQS